MKALFTDSRLFLAALCLFGATALTSCEENGKNESKPTDTTAVASPVVAPAPGTSLVVKNGTNTATTVVFTLAASGGACTAPLTADTLAAWGLCGNVGNVGPDAPYAENCTQVLNPHDSITIPGYANLCISGTVTFDALPNCPCETFPNGVTQAEFTLNTSNKSEVIDITLVNGNSNVIAMDMIGGGSWLLETTDSAMSHIQNLPFPASNADNPGIYPPNCTVCTGTNNDAPCTLPNTPCSSNAICQMQRTNGVGGKVVITLVSSPAQGTNSNLPACPAL